MLLIYADQDEQDQLYTDSNCIFFSRGWKGNVRDARVIASKPLKKLFSLCESFFY